jgi:pimeloyl-ACP methyl ester carboxylesterase
MTSPTGGTSRPAAVPSTADATRVPQGYRTVIRPDGRTVEYLVEGDPGGFPLVLHHGTPGSAWTYPHASAVARSKGLALVLPGRPGYGESTPCPGRRVADVAWDIAALLDDLGREEFITLGWSGGGPHALACAAILPKRCRAAATGAGVAPFHGPGLDFFRGMGMGNVAEYTAALVGRDELQPLLESEAARYDAASVEEVADALGGLLSPVDRAYATGDFAARLRGSFTRAVTYGVEGWIEDDLAFTRPWGFDLAGITVPVSIWHGAEDQMVPFTHGEWLSAQVIGSSAHLYDEEGHLSLWNKLDAVVDDLITQARL